MLNLGVFWEITVKTSFMQFSEVLAQKWAPGPMKNHRNYCCFSMPAGKPVLHVIIWNSSILMNLTGKVRFEWKICRVYGNELIRVNLTPSKR